MVEEATSDRRLPPWWSAWDLWDASLLILLAVCLAYAMLPWKTLIGSAMMGDSGEPFKVHGPVGYVVTCLAGLFVPLRVLRRVLVTVAILGLGIFTWILRDFHLWTTTVATYPAQGDFFFVGGCTALVSVAATVAAIRQAVRLRRAGATLTASAS